MIFVGAEIGKALRYVGTRAAALAQLRPRGSRGCDQAGWSLTALPEQWKRGVNANEWIEYVPALLPVELRCPTCKRELLVLPCTCACGAKCFREWRCNGCGRDDAGCICDRSL